MKNILFGLIILFGGSSVFASDITLWKGQEINTPFIHTIDFLDASTSSSDDLITTIDNSTTNTTYERGTILAQYVDPRSDGFSGFPAGACTEYVARQRPELFVNEDGTRYITGNAEDWLRNAQKLGLETGREPQQGAIAVFYEGRGARQYGHVAYVQDIQSNGTIIVSEMNYENSYVVTYRVIDADLAAGYIY